MGQGIWAVAAVSRHAYLKSGKSTGQWRMVDESTAVSAMAR
jgi:hypothetical protein